MRKANKIVMMTVAMLLSAVLLTTSALSGTLAKYVTSGGSHSESARVAKWGVTVRAWVDADDIARLRAAGATVTTSDTNEMMVSISNLKFKPGDDFSDVIHFEITGKPEVKAKVKFSVWVNYPKKSGDYYYTLKVPSGVANLTEDTYFMPIGFTFGAVDTTGSYVNSYLAEPWRYHAGTNPGGSNLGLNNTENAIAAGVAAKMDVTKKNYDNSFSRGFEKTFAPTKDIVFHPKTNSTVNKNININQFDMGFAYPMEWPPADKTDYKYSPDQIDKIGMFLAEQETSTITITYKIEVVQENS